MIERKGSRRIKTRREIVNVASHVHLFMTAAKLEKGTVSVGNNWAVGEWEGGGRS